MSTSQIVAAQSSLWFVIPAFFSFFVYVITMVGETNRLPFDLAEGEGELTGGFHTEYGSMRFAMFFLGEYINMFTVAALATTMFLGGWQAPPGIAAINDGMFNEGWWGLLWFTVKLWMFMFVFVWLRGSLPRVRYDQFMRFGWKFLIPATLGWVVLVAFFRAGQNGWLDWFGDHRPSPGRTFPGSSLLLVGVIAVLALVLGWMWDRRAEAKEAVVAPDRARGDRPVRRGLPRAAPARPAPARALARRTGPDRPAARPRRPFVADEQKKSGFFSDLFAPVGGFGVTFATMFRKVATEEYPEEKRPTQPRFHGRHQLNRHPDGLEKCVGCELCAWACPADAILVEGADNDDTEGGAGRFSPGERYGRVYQINYLRCIFCGLCIEACPTRALTMTNFYELADNNRADLIFTKDQLLAPLQQGMLQPPFPMADGLEERDYYLGKVSSATDAQARVRRARTRRTTDDAEVTS